MSYTFCLAYKAIPLSITLLALTACGSAPPITPDQPSPEGRLTIMGAASSFNLDAPPADWIVSGGGREASTAISNVVQDGLSALEIKSGPERIVAVRQIDAMMLATPYLSWKWHLSNHGAGIHPIRLVVGFQGGLPEELESAAQGTNLPHHDRALALIWGDTALRRGSMSLPPPATAPFEAPLYTVRGGRENTRKWWPEAVDLSDLYAKAWPNDNHRKVRITFIGLAAAPTQKVVRGRVSGIFLTH